MFCTKLADNFRRPRANVEIKNNGGIIYLLFLPGQKRVRRKLQKSARSFRPSAEQEGLLIQGRKITSLQKCFELFCNNKNNIRVTKKKGSKNILIFISLQIFNTISNGMDTIKQKSSLQLAASAELLLVMVFSVCPLLSFMLLN